jgi:hypothetical protein
MHDATQQLDLVLFKLHPRPATKPESTSCEFSGNVSTVDAHVRWHAFNQRDECLTV